MIEIKDVGHIGIRVANEAVAMKFYELLGFKLRRRADGDAVTIMSNDANVEINLVINANDNCGGKNILMDVAEKIPGITHIAYNVASVKETMKVLAENDIEIRQGPVKFPGEDHVAIFIRDPDLNVIELRSHAEEIETEEYIP
jgi:lactoylglutathione lyase